MNAIDEVHGFEGKYLMAVSALLFAFNGILQICSAKNQQRTRDLLRIAEAAHRGLLLELDGR